MELAAAIDFVRAHRQSVLTTLRRDGKPQLSNVLHAVDADAERTLFPGTRPFPIAVLTGNAGDLLMAVWHRIPTEVLTVDGDPGQAAAMLELVRIE